MAFIGYNCLYVADVSIQSAPGEAVNAGQDAA